MFKDRIDAGQQLSDALLKFKDKPDTVVVALPRGGVVPAYVMACELHLPLEVAMVKKIGHPANPEYAIGAVSLRNRVIHDRQTIDADYLETKTNEIRALLRERWALYHDDREPISFKGKTVIVVDDGVATGSTMIAAIETIRSEQPQQIVVAIPVAPAGVLSRLQQNADRVFCLESHTDFIAIGLYYQEFTQVSDAEVKRLLELVAPKKARTDSTGD